MWFGKLKGLLKASHFGPTLLVTAISFGFATYYWWEGPAYLIAFGVFTGQLVVGWSNDLYDYQDDLSHNRKNKPLISGQITKELLQNWLKWVTPFSFIANLIGPLGVKGGLVYMLGILCGVAYNFYFKFSVLSPLPYAIAFAALPSSIAISKGITPPVWMWLGGALFGVAAHFVNVLKDMKEDQISKIGGLPQRLGTKNSIWVAIILVALGIAAIIITS
ncbi:MAG: UbiA family prenyltransferase [Actinobacteria bacterium]|nr:UbiA family prenyltransferase [Actinomycetota bacterium]